MKPAGMSRQSSSNARYSVAVAVVASLSLLAIESQVELGIAIGACYIAIVLLISTMCNMSYVIATADVSSILILLGWIVSPAGGELASVMANRILSIVLVWTVTGLIAKRISLYNELIGKQQEFEQALRHSAELEKRFRQVVDSAPSGMVMINRAGEIVLVNQEAERQFQYRRDEIVGQPVEKLLPENYRADHPGKRDAFFAAPSVRAMGSGRELFGRRRDGSQFPVEIGLNPVQVSGEPYVLSSVVDITERRIHEEAIKQSEERLRAVLEAALDAVIGMDIDGKVTAWNRQAEVIFGWGREEVLGKSVADLIIPTELRPSHRAGIEKFRETGEGPVLNARLEMEAVRNNGERFPVELTILPLHQAGKPYFTAFVRDISARRSAQLKIQSMNAELTLKNDELQQFVYTVSHDLKSPLVTLEGFVGLLRQELNEGNMSEVLQCAERIERASQKMGQLIQDLLQLSRVGTVRNDPEMVSVSELVTDVCLDLKSQWEEHGIDIQVQDDMPTLFTDRIRLGQVFENLVSNAIKYGCSPQNPRISISGELSENDVIFRVHDNGAGIPQEHHERIFRPFERLDSPQEGTGIGLAIVVRIVEQNGGTVRLESQPGAGTTFLLVFPRTLSEHPKQTHK